MTAVNMANVAANSLWTDSSIPLSVKLLGGVLNAMELPIETLSAFCEVAPVVDRKADGLITQKVIGVPNVSTATTYDTPISAGTLEVEAGVLKFDKLVRIPLKVSDYTSSLSSNDDPLVLQDATYQMGQKVAESIFNTVTALYIEYSRQMNVTGTVSTNNTYIDPMVDYDLLYQYFKAGTGLSPVKTVPPMRDGMYKLVIPGSIRTRIAQRIRDKGLTTVENQYMTINGGIGSIANIATITCEQIQETLNSSGTIKTHHCFAVGYGGIRIVPHKLQFDVQEWARKGVDVSTEIPEKTGVPLTLISSGDGTNMTFRHELVCNFGVEVRYPESLIYVPCTSTVV